MLQDLRHQHDVEAVVCVRKSQSIADLCARLGVGGNLTFSHHRVEHLGHIGHIALGLVECDDICTATEHLERVPALARTDVDHLGV